MPIAATVWGIKTRMILPRLALAWLVASVSILFLTLTASAETCLQITTFADGNVPDREVFVAVTGSDSAGDGSRAKPFRTLARAAQGVRAGTAIRLLPGTHTPGASLSGLTGTAEAPIWIGGVPGESRPVISGGSQAFQLSRARYVVVENLEVAGSTANGINCDDGGLVANPEATRFVVFRNIIFRNIGATANQDGLKLSGVNDFWVLDCEFLRGSSGGSGIDQVGCHRGVIAGCRFENQGNAIQCKGGSEDVEILGCRFLNAGQRAVNLGGSTGFEFFRPPLARGTPQAEARNIRVIACEFQGSDAPVAFVGSLNCLVANNTFVNPTRWVARILQETVSSGGYTFAPSASGRFINNIVYFRRSALSTFVNVGGNTAPNTFTFANNLWYAHDNPAGSTPSLPVSETGGIARQDPQFTDAAGSNYTLRATSPAIGKGRALAELTSDFGARCFAATPSIGAHEFAEAALARSDADAMPDWWEARFGLDRLETADGALDPDADGHSNEEEYLAGTDPRDARSVFRILGIERQAAGVKVRFSTVIGRAYVLEQRDGSTPFVETSTPAISGNGGVAEAAIADAATATSNWLRVRSVLR